MIFYIHFPGASSKNAMLAVFVSQKYPDGIFVKKLQFFVLFLWGKALAKNWKT